MPKFHHDPERNAQCRRLWAVWIDADNAWQAEIVKVVGAKRAGDFRYTKAARGEPGTQLHVAHEALFHAEQAFHVAGGIGWLQSACVPTS